MVGRARHDRLRWAAALLLWAMFALALTSLRDEAPTFDERVFSSVAWPICGARLMAAARPSASVIRWA